MNLKVITVALCRDCGSRTLVQESIAGPPAGVIQSSPVGHFNILQ